MILFEAAARELKRLGAVPLPTTEQMQKEKSALAARKVSLKAKLQQAKDQAQIYDVMRRNVEDFLSAPRTEQVHEQELE